MERKTTWEFACDYVGDPISWERRGKIIADFLKDEGLRPYHQVLSLGCGNLSEGVPLIRFLDPRNFAGIEPNGWLINVALERFPDLEAKQPEFSYNTDFDASVFSSKFDYVVAHSVLSHCAHWQFSMALHGVRKGVEEGAIWLASYRRSDTNSWSKEWQYPGVSTIRVDTLAALAHHAGWQTIVRDDLKDRLTSVCSNDVHDWVEFKAIMTPEQANDQSVQDGKREAMETEIREIAEQIYKERQEQLLRDEADAA